MNFEINSLTKISLLFVLILFYSHTAFAQENSAPYLILTSPNGGEQWEANSTRTITWQSSNISKVKIEYSLSNGLSWNTITSSVDAYLGNYLWAVADARTPYVLIRISDANNPITYDVSDTSFSVYIRAPKQLNKTSQVDATIVKIMPLGDSITWGDPDPSANGYRRSLYQQLLSAGYNIDFVGSLTGGVPNDFDRDNEGHGGWGAYAYPNTNGSLYHHLDGPTGFLTQNPPNIILLHIGTNDMHEWEDGYYNTPQTLSFEVRDILDKINNFDPTITVFLARIINRGGDDSLKQKTTKFNDSLQVRANELIASGKKIVVVNMESALSYPSDLADGLHPNPTGYQKMANLWFKTIQNYYKPVLTSPDSNTFNLPIDTLLSWNAPPAASYMSAIYQVQISTDDQFTNLVFNDENVTTTSRSTTGYLGYDTKYYWRVRINGYGWSTVWNFTTGANPVAGCPANMISYWKLDETSGPPYDDYYNGHDGSAGTSQPDATPSGQINGGQQFNGTNDEINVPPSTDFDFAANSSFAIEFWIKHSAGVSASNEVIIGRDDASSQLHWWIGLNGAGQVAFYLVSTSGEGHSIVGTTALDNNNWHNVTAIKDAVLNQLRIYVDGALEVTTSASYSIAGFNSSTANINIGWLNLDQGFHFKGAIDEVAIHSTVISDLLIKQDFRNGLAGLDYCNDYSVPVISSESVTNGLVGQLYTYDVDAIGNPSPAYSLEIFPAGMTIDGTTGVITWTPTLAQTGNNSVKVKATNTIDLVDYYDYQEFNINVQVGITCPANMISYWKLDEASGPPYDDYYNGHDGSAGTSQPDATPSGQINGGQQFNGTNDEINVPPSTDFDFAANSSFTIEFWIKHSAGVSASNEVIIGRDDASSQLHWWIGLNGAGKATFYLISTSGVGNSIVGTTALDDNNWHNVTAIKDGVLNQLRIYVDGKLEVTTSASYSIAGFNSSTANINIGWLNLDLGYHFEGALDEVAIYNNALDVNEIRYNYEKGIAGKGYCEPYVLLSSKVFLEGPYDATTSDVMFTNLRINSLIPLTSPYSQNPRTVSAIPADVVDWVLVELRSNLSGPAVLSKSVFLHKSGNLVADDGTTQNIFLAIASGDYYIVIKHRNHLGIMSAAPPVTLSTSANFYDFTTGSGQFYGGGAGAKLIDTSPSDVWGMIAGDANSNGEVTYNGAANDKNSILAEVGLLTPNNVVSGYSNNDTNMDGLVSYNGASNDKNVILGVVGLTTPNNIIQTQVP